MTAKLPQVLTDFYPLTGGLDLESPAIAISPGKLFDAQNYEPNTSGGYRRIDGYERYDGRPSPTAADYWVLTLLHIGAITLGSTLSNLAGTASAKVMKVVGNDVILARLNGVFLPGDVLVLS